MKVAKKGTLKPLTAECIQNWSEAIVVKNVGKTSVQKPSSWIPYKIWKKRFTWSGVSIRSGVQTQENLNYTTTETHKEHRSLAIATSKQTSEELNANLELLPAFTTTVLQHVEHGELFRETGFCASNLLLQEGNKFFELVKSYGFVHEQQFALQDDWNEDAMYEKLCHVAMKHDKPVEGNVKSETKSGIQILERNLILTSR